MLFRNLLTYLFEFITAENKLDTISCVALTAEHCQNLSRNGTFCIILRSLPNTILYVKYLCSRL